MTTIDIFRHEKETIHFSANTIVIQEGDAGDFMYAVRSGTLEVMHNGMVIETVTEGGIVGEMALIDSKPRSAAVIAKTDSELVKVDKKRFQFLVQQTPFFALHVMQILVDRLRKMHNLK